MFNWFKKKKYTNEQEAKLKSMKTTLDKVYKSIEEHIALNDPKIIALNDLEFLIGVAQLMFEDVFLKEVKQYATTGKLPEGAMGEVIKNSTITYRDELPTSKVNVQSAERDFEKPEFTIKKKMFH